MSLKRTIAAASAAALAICLLGTSVAPAAAAPSTAQTDAEKARLERALERLAATQRKADALAAQTAAASLELDRIVAEQAVLRTRLSSRAVVMYRSGDTSFVSVLLGASSYAEFSSRWDLLKRMSRQDAADLAELAAAQRRARKSADGLMRLQAEQARALDAVQRDAAAARKRFRLSEAALAAARARAAAAKSTAAKTAKTAAPKPPKADPKQKLTGTGDWKTAVASHYSKNFSGKGASGQRIGPYSMIVAHRTLPFGTLVEIEYGGKRAVASVADRGPFTPGRTFDLGPGVVRALGFSGVHQVRYRVIGR